MFGVDWARQPQSTAYLRLEDEPLNRRATSSADDHAGFSGLQGGDAYFHVDLIDPRDFWP